MLSYKVRNQFSFLVISKTVVLTNELRILASSAEYSAAS